MDIIAFVEAPIGLKNIIMDALNGLEEYVEHVYIGENLAGMNGKVGAVDVHEGEPLKMDILIDLLNCTKASHWCDKGMLYVPNVWYNILYAVYHEAHHVCQLVGGDKPDEHDADVWAIEDMYRWSTENQVPTLASMGWAGKQIRKVLNSVYHKYPNMVDEEVDVIETGAVARSCVAAEASKSFETPEEMASLHQHILEGHAGLVVNGRTYLNAEEFFCIDDHYSTPKEEVHNNDEGDV